MEPIVSSETSAIKSQTPIKMEPIVSSETSAIKSQTPIKMEPIVSSETSAIKSQTPGNYPKRNKLHLQHGESLKRKFTFVSVFQNARWSLPVDYQHGGLDLITSRINK